MTGGGFQIRVDGVRNSRGFIIHCDVTLANNLEINWPGGNKWHITKEMIDPTCIDDPIVEPDPPPAPFDTFIPEAEGQLNKDNGISIVRFKFVDAGEPGSNDRAWIAIWAPERIQRCMRLFSRRVPLTIRRSWPAATSRHISINHISNHPS